MTRYKYTDTTEQAVARIDDDGVSRLSCALNHPEFVAWLAEGNTPEAADIPVPPTDAERIDAVFPQTDVGRVIFEAFYELANDVRVLKGQGTITKAQLRDWFIAKLGG